MANDPPNTHTQVVPDVSCDHCKRTIEKQVGQLVDVTPVAVDVNARTVTVTGGNTNAMTTAIAGAGYAIA